MTLAPGEDIDKRRLELGVFELDGGFLRVEGGRADELKPMEGDPPALW
jgi:hypothetical protein